MVEKQLQENIIQSPLETADTRPFDSGLFIFAVW